MTCAALKRIPPHTHTHERSPDLGGAFGAAVPSNTVGKVHLTPKEEERERARGPDAERKRMRMKDGGSNRGDGKGFWLSSLPGRITKSFLNPRERDRRKQKRGRRKRERERLVF